MSPYDTLLVLAAIFLVPFLSVAIYLFFSMQLLWMVAGWDHIMDRSLWWDYLRERKYLDSDRRLERFFGNNFEIAKTAWSWTWSMLPKLILVFAGTVVVWVLWKLVAR